MSGAKRAHRSSIIHGTRESNQRDTIQPFPLKTLKHIEKIAGEIAQNWHQTGAPTTVLFSLIAGTIYSLFWEGLNDWPEFGDQ